MSWKRVRGHDALIAGFERVINKGRLAHAYLFLGPPGVGKRLFALELARALLCEAPPEGRFDACDRCPACVQIEARTHPDFALAGLPPEKHEWPIEQMREVLRNFGLKSSRGKGKVVILDDADDFNEESANCFLKTLEEPPPRAVLILIGTSRDRQLPTIVSRCQSVSFAPLPERQMVELLREQGIADEGLAQRLARLSGGSPGEALSLADPGLWEFRRTFLSKLTAKDADTVALSRELMDYVEQAGKDSAAQRQRATVVLRLLIEFLNDALRVQMGSPPRLDDPEEQHALKAITQRADVEPLLHMLDRCLEGEGHVDRRVQLVLALEALVDALGKQLTR